MKRILVMVAALVLLGTYPLSAETVSRIAAIVNQEIITTAQLDREMRELLAQAPPDREPAAEQLPALRRQLLQKMIEETLIQQRVAALGIEVTDEEVSQAIEDVQRQNNVDRPQLEQALAAQGLSFQAYREQMRSQLLNFKLVNREIRRKIEVTNQELRDYYQAHQDQYRTAPYKRLSRITFNLPSDAWPARIGAVRAKAEEALQRLRSGENPQQLLERLNAADPNIEGGDMGTFTPGTLTPPFSTAVDNLAAGQYSEVIETSLGFHILRVDERSAGEMRSFDSVREEIRRQLMEAKREEAINEWAESLQKNADIEIRL